MIASLAMALVLLSEQPEQVAAEATPPKSDYICKMFRQTGSHVKKSFVCLTKKEWARMDDQNEAFSRRMVDEARGGIAGY